MSHTYRGGLEVVVVRLLRDVQLVYHRLFASLFGLLVFGFVEEVGPDGVAVFQGFFLVFLHLLAEILNNTAISFSEGFDVVL